MPETREQNVARLLVDEMSAQERERLAEEVRADPASAEFEAQMRATLDAFQVWAQQTERPAKRLAVPPIARRKPASRWPMLAAAAVLLLALSGATYHLLRQEPIRKAMQQDLPTTNPPQTKHSGFDELAWVEGVLPPKEAAPARGQVRFDPPKEVMAGGLPDGADTGSQGGGSKTDSGDTQLFGAPGDPGSQGSKGSQVEGGGPTIGAPVKKPQGGTDASDPGAPANPALDGFAKQFDFKFRVPEQLPGGFVFSRGKPIHSKAVQLVYTGPSQPLIVFLSPARAGDGERKGTVQALTFGARKLLCIRSAGLCAGFQGPLKADEIPELIKAFTRKEEGK